MARYFFDVHDGAYFQRDDEGTALDGEKAAVQSASRSAAEIGPAGKREHLRRRHPGAG
ncbi:DUF6894 family protein [Microvirga arsenatis]|uniref:DUF6894 domain-containing protein n=1 Tax=Microvirga arsenatis TaxID=2692265 RepID=A0ABW9Z372_9HYPH|nr:hypothetical protein [Microvirga arsenatis]NBJ13485.1 hypothetical protein [Microvirga arsenatis]NBJ26977.1 hypothetical protein [Microvirga arsenatis]